MEEARFIISRKRYKEDSTVISMRIPKDMLADIDKLAKETARTRNEVLYLALEFALTHTDPGDRS